MENPSKNLLRNRLTNYNETKHETETRIVIRRPFLKKKEDNYFISVRLIKLLYFLVVVTEAPESRVGEPGVRPRSETCQPVLKKRKEAVKENKNNL